MVNPLQTIATDDLVGKLSLSLDRKLIAVFMQDEVPSYLSVSLIIA